MALSDVATAAGQSAALWAAVLGLWLLVSRLEARATARRQLDTYRARVWR